MNIILTIPAWANGKERHAPGKRSNHTAGRGFNSHGGHSLFPTKEGVKIRMVQAHFLTKA